MKYSVFEINFLPTKIILEWQEMADSIRLENLFLTRQKKDFAFFVFDYLRELSLSYLGGGGGGGGGKWEDQIEKIPSEGEDHKESFSM